MVGILLQKVISPYPLLCPKYPLEILGDRNLIKSLGLKSLDIPWNYKSKQKHVCRYFSKFLVSGRLLLTRSCSCHLPISPRIVCDSSVASLDGIYFIISDPLKKLFIVRTGCFAVCLLKCLSLMILIK